MKTIDIRVSRLAIGFLALIALLCLVLAVLERDMILLASSLLFGGIVALGLGYQVQISGNSLRGGVRVLGFQISAWDIDLRSADVHYLLPRWLGPLSVLVVFGENQTYHVTPVLKGKERIIEHIQQCGLEAAA
jgi:hypothetical protein